MIAGRHFKNEDNIKAKIFRGHKNGVCDSNGKSIRRMNTGDQRVFVAKPRHVSSVTKVYVYEKGKMVLKNG